jgi:hypothetical protein
MNNWIMIILIFFSISKEEGWLMGIKEGTSDKGIFPANFTKPV